MNEKKPIVINMVGGPGTFKSAISSGVFVLLKMHGISCELVSEFAKSLTWHKQYDLLADQEYVFKNQNSLLSTVSEFVDVVVLDTSLLLSNIYNRDVTSDEFKNKVLETFNSYNNLTFNLVRNTEVPYEEVGRNQCLSDACDIDRVINNMLENSGVKYTIIKSCPDAINVITKQVMEVISSELMFNVKFEHC